MDREKVFMRSYRFFSSLFVATVVCALVLGVSSDRAHAQVTTFYYSDFFDAANPMLPVEDFQEANVAAGRYTFISSPLSYDTNTSPFATGDILPGLSLATSGSSASFGFVVVGDGTNPGASKSVGNSNFGGGLELSFASGTKAVGLNLYTSSDPGFITSSTLSVVVFDSGGQISSALVRTGRSIAFVGFSSITPITRVSLSNQTGNDVIFVDNVEFQSSAAAPEPSTLILLGMGFISGARTFRVVRRQRQNFV